MNMVCNILTVTQQRVQWWIINYKLNGELLTLQQKGCSLAWPASYDFHVEHCLRLSLQHAPFPRFFWFLCEPWFRTISQLSLSLCVFACAYGRMLKPVYLWVLMHCRICVLTNKSAQKRTGTCVYTCVWVWWQCWGSVSQGLLSELPAQRTCLFSLVASDSVSEQLPSQQGPVPSHPPCQHTHVHTHTHHLTNHTCISPALPQLDYDTHSRARTRTPPTPWESWSLVKLDHWHSYGSLLTK